MDSNARRERLAQELLEAAGGSFAIMYRALNEARAEASGGPLNKDDVIARIHRIRNPHSYKQTA